VITNTVSAAAGSVLEGQIDLLAAWGGVSPDSVRVAFAGYASPDGGALAFQVPCGNGDANLDASEWVTVRNRTLSAVRPPVRGASSGGDAPWIELRASNPARGEIRAVVHAAPGSHVVVDLADIQGRHIARLHDGRVAGSEVAVRASAAGVPAGVYVLIAHTPAGTASRRVVAAP
jgi:hypothetical protein